MEEIHSVDEMKYDFSTAEDLTGDGGVLMYKTKTCEDGEFAVEGYEASVHYTGRLPDSLKVFDSSHDRNTPIKFVLGKGQVIKGWDIAVQKLRIGEQAKLKISPEYAYGASGAGEDIKPNATLLFDVELVDCQPKEVDASELSPAEKLERALQRKNDGNLHLKTQEYDQAVDKYMQCTELLSYWEDKNLASEANKLVISVHLNMALAHHKNCNPSEAVRSASKALEMMDPNEDPHTRSKGLYRRGVGRMGNGDYEDAKKDFESALTLDSTNMEVKSKLTKCKIKIKELKAIDRKTYANLFQRTNMYSEKPRVYVEMNYNELPLVFLDLDIINNNNTTNVDLKCRLVICLYSNIAPKTCRNFLALCTGEKKTDSNSLCYRETTFHRFIKGFMMQGGDVNHKNGLGGESIYGPQFDDEEFAMKHEQRGVLSMANCGPNTNGSQFFVLFNEAPHLNGKHVVFGKIVEGLEKLDAIEQYVETDQDDAPKNCTITIKNCGQLLRKGETLPDPQQTNISYEIQQEPVDYMNPTPETTATPDDL